MSSNPAHVLPPTEPAPSPQAAEAGGTAPTVATHPRRMLDRYEIVAEIAKGGMGTVYLARLEGAGGFERLMALKLMHEHLADDDQFVTMLLDEARTAASIHHPNAVGIVDVCESPVGYYLVMNYVDGFSLWQVMTHPALSDRDRVRLSTRLIADALHGLHAAHTAKNAKGEKLGIVHRDVSPQNVLVGSDGMGRIVDFGIALAASRVTASRPGVLKGKPSYMAPEQARGDACDGRTDVFSMGIVLWEALVNERLFWAEMDVAVLMQVMDCNIERPDARRPEIATGLADVVMKALARSPADRFATARDFAIALEKAADAAGMLASTPEIEEKLGEIFVDEMSEKQRAIGGHLSASSGAPVLLQKGQLGTVPRLIAKKPASRDLPTRGGISTSGVRSRGSQPDAKASGSSSSASSASVVVDAAYAPTSTATPLAHARDSSATGAGVTGASPPAAPAPASRQLGLVLGIVGLVLGVVALALYLGRDEATAPGPRGVERSSGEPAAGPPEPPTAAAPEPTIAAPAPAAPAEAAPALAAPAETAPAETAPAEASRGATPRVRRTRAEGSAPAAASGPPAAGGSGTLEANPYLTH